MLAVGCHLSCCFYCCGVVCFLFSWAIGWLKATAAQTIGHGPSGLCSRSDWFKTGKAFRSRRHMSVFLASDRCLAGWTAVGKTDGRLPGPMDGSSLLWESANHRNIIWAKPLIWVKFTLLPHFHWAGLVLRQLAIVMGRERWVSGLNNIYRCLLSGVPARERMWRLG